MRILPFDLSGRRALGGRALDGRAAGGRLWIALACGAALASRAPMGLADRPFHDEPAYALIAAPALMAVLCLRQDKKAASAPPLSAQ